MSCQTTARFPLSYQQKRVWEEQLKRPVRRATCWVEVYGAIDGDRLRKCIRNVISEHEILRTAICPDGESGQSLQVHDDADFVWAHEDLSKGDELADA